MFVPLGYSCRKHDIIGGGGGGDKIAIIIGECCNVVNIIQSYDVCACFYKIDVRGRIFE